MLSYESTERALFQRLVDGEITQIDYLNDSLDAMQEFSQGFSADELLTARTALLAQHAKISAVVSQLGKPYPGNDPNHPN